MLVRSRILAAAIAAVAVAGVTVGYVALEPTPVSGPIEPPAAAPTESSPKAPKPTPTAARSLAPAPSSAAGTEATPEAEPAPAPPPPPAPEPEPAPPAAAPPATSADPAEARVIELVNAERAASGCAPVSHDEGLAGVARAHSADMALNDFFSHVNLLGLDPFDRAAQAGVTARAENIAAGQPDADSVMAGWMGSTGHRDNILNCGLTRLGVGVGHGGSYGITWTQLFA